MHTNWASMIAMAAVVACGAVRGEVGEEPSTTPRQRSASARTDEHQTVSRTIVTPLEAYSVEALYQRAESAAAKRDWEEAARLFDRIAQLDPEGPLAVSALYQAGVSHDNAGADRGNRERALARFRLVLAREPDGAWAGSAALRSLRLALHLERWELGDQMAQALVSHSRSPTPPESVLVRAAQALWAIENGDTEGAERHVDAGLATVEDNRMDQAGRLSRDVAALYYAVGELRRVQAEAIQFVPVPHAFSAVLERRCQRLLDAQRAYSDAMRAYDAHWSSMAGVRTSELYAALHQDLMQVPPPNAAESEARRDLFEGAMRLRYSILLEKALAMVNHTLAMVERTGERSEWLQRAEEAQRSLLVAKDREDQAIGRLPYSKAELKAALDELAAKAAAATRARP